MSLRSVSTGGSSRVGRAGLSGCSWIESALVLASVGEVPPVCGPEGVLCSVSNVHCESLGLEGVGFPPVEGVPLEARRLAVSELTWGHPPFRKTAEICAATFAQGQGHLPWSLDAPSLRHGLL
jgi:hypothetical protein